MLQKKLKIFSEDVDSMMTHTLRRVGNNLTYGIFLQREHLFPDPLHKYGGSRCREQSSNGQRPCRT